MDYATYAKEAGPTCDFRYEHLITAIKHLYKAIELLTYVNNEIVDNTIDSMDLVDKLSDGWLEVNKCRLYTEKMDYYEELLVPSLGLINDAKSMLESLVQWKMGMTLHAKRNILNSIKEAALDGINPSLAELEACLKID